MKSMIDDVRRYIPQRDPFVFVSGMEEHSEVSSVTFFKVHDGCPLVDGGCLTEAGVIEFVAQSCALHLGYASPEDTGIGFIGALSAFRFGYAPAVGDVVRCRVEMKGRYDNLVMASGEVTCGDDFVAEGSIKISIVSE